MTPSFTLGSRMKASCRGPAPKLWKKPKTLDGSAARMTCATSATFIEDGIQEDDDERDTFFDRIGEG